MRINPLIELYFNFYKEYRLKPTVDTAVRRAGPGCVLGVAVAAIAADGRWAIIANRATCVIGAGNIIAVNIGISRIRIAGRNISAGSYSLIQRRDDCRYCWRPELAAADFLLAVPAAGAHLLAGI
jgi:hypothetical protein